jgi:transposase
MSFYCGIDLGARESQICVINKRVKKVLELKTRNKLEVIKQVLEPYKASLEIVVESTFNWYWLVDGLQAAGFQVVLAHTLGLHMITAAKVKTDRRDAFALAKLLLAGMIPAAYIYPAETRAVRDLLRRRARLVQVRAGEYGSLRRLLLRHGILSSKQQEIRSGTVLSEGPALLRTTVAAPSGTGATDGGLQHHCAQTGPGYLSHA